MFPSSKVNQHETRFYPLTILFVINLASSFSLEIRAEEKEKDNVVVVRALTWQIQQSGVVVPFRRLSETNDAETIFCSFSNIQR